VTLTPILFPFLKPNSFTTLKKRYINVQRNEKLFKIEFLDDCPINNFLEEEIIRYLEKVFLKYDILLVGDFGHGFINEKIINFLEKNAKYLSVNVQTNSSNLGFNYIDKYKYPTFSTMDIREMQYVVRDKFSEYPDLISKFANKTGYKNFLVTLGKKGCAYYDGSIYFAPIFKTGSVDTVGTGDAIFSIVSLLHYVNTNSMLIPFYANCIGNIAAQIMGNKESVTKTSLKRFIQGIYNEQ